MSQEIVMPQGIEKVTIQLIDTPTKVYAIGATRIMISKGMVSKGQYSKFGTVKGFQYSF